VLLTVRPVTRYESIESVINLIPRLFSLMLGATATLGTRIVGDSVRIFVKKFEIGKLKFNDRL
jgi:hypothetical protein